MKDKHFWTEMIPTLIFIYTDWREKQVCIKSVSKPEASTLQWNLFKMQTCRPLADLFMDEAPAIVIYQAHQVMLMHLKFNNP
jgi:hypothetical protein